MQTVGQNLRIVVIFGAGGSEDEHVASLVHQRLLDGTYLREFIVEPLDDVSRNESHPLVYQDYQGENGQRLEGKGETVRHGSELEIDEGIAF